MDPSSEAEVTLLTAPHSPFAQRVRIALEEKGISYRLIDVDFSNKPQLLLKSNPINEMVPTIIHKGKTVEESLVILEYLEDAFPEPFPLMPKDAFERSKCRFWVDYICKSFCKFTNIIMSSFGSPEQSTTHEEAITRLKTLETAMTSYSTQGPWLTGETFGYLDVVLAPIENYLYVTEKVGGLIIPWNEIPRVHKWIEAMSGRPSYLAVIPRKEEALSFLKASFERRAAATFSVTCKLTTTAAVAVFDVRVMDTCVNNYIQSSWVKLLLAVSLAIIIVTAFELYAA